MKRCLSYTVIFLLLGCFLFDTLPFALIMIGIMGLLLLAGIFL